MKDTTFWPTEAQLKRIAKSYKPNADKTGLEETTVAVPEPEAQLSARACPWPAGGLFSTAADLAKVYQMVLNGGTLNGHQFLKPETLKQMTTNQTA